MGKELDYLDKILNYQPLTLVERTIIECIKEKIQRLESIDNANPSEALECLEKVYSRLPQWDLSRNVDQCNIIKNYILKAQKLEKENAKYKQLEEQIGCPLEVVIKALKEGIYYIYPNGNIVLERSFKLNHYSSGWCLIKPKLNFKLEDYKKTWWLKRDKSE